MSVPRVVIDTNVLVAASRSGKGASAKLLALTGTGRFDLVVSVPLVIEYEDAVLRRIQIDSQRHRDWEDILDYLCSVAENQDIFFLWRPHLKDPKDDMVLEVAVAGRCNVIVSSNTRDFTTADAFGIEVMRPKDFLDRIGALE